jgi:lysozyme
MPSSNFGSKFFGEERYQQYVDELTAEGTLGGKKLSPEERKEGFKKRNDKIGFEEFVNKVLEKKSAATTMAASKASLPGGVGGGGGGALIKAPKGGLVKADISKITPQESSNILEDILKIVTSIRDTLIEKNKFDADQSKKDKQSAERERRAKKEKKLESGIFKGLGKATEKILAPVKGLFEKVFDFIKTVILGNIVYNIVKWMGDPENERKINNLIRFLKDFWPVIAGAYLLFGTKFGALIRTIGGWAVQIIKFAVPKLLRFVTRNPRTAAVLAGAGYLGARILTGTEVGGDEEESSDQQTQQFQADQATKQAEAATPKPVQMSAGGRVPGSGNKDTVPAMLTPGEFVMSKGAVAKYGTSTLASMNTMGGGSNIPSLMGGGVLGFSGGGSVSPDEEPGGRNKEKTEDPTKESSGGGFGDWVMSFFRGGDKPKSEEGGDKEGGSGISKNAKALLNTIRWAEGTLKPDGYNTWFGGRSDMDLTKMSIDEVVAEQKRRLSNGEATYGQYTSAAVGAYQMMKPEAFASAAGLSGKSLFTPENQDKMAIAGYMMGQAGMTQAEIDAPISRSQIAKMAPVWASLPMTNGRSRYGQPVKRYEDLAKVYNKNLNGLDPNSYSTSTSIASSISGGGGGRSGGGGGRSGGGGGGGVGGGLSTPPTPKTSLANLQKAIDFKPAKSAPSIGLPVQRMNANIDALRAAIDGASAPQTSSTSKALNNEIPNISAAIMQSPSKVKTLGVVG